ncbi:MAG: asparagine synthase (glutamine-hydrolyzing) [Anaerolineales bacterium]|jgi:asparagine synthase (glutamine-hydrolysing)
MCGIVGICNLNGEPADRALLQRMNDRAAHRGPDGDGCVVAGPVGLGHRRLAIIDLSAAANQPLSNEAGDLWIVYNGEVYNFESLRDDLEKKGHLFKTRTDSEVVLHAYEEWGEACVDRFNGMFAFAILDRRASFNRGASSNNGRLFLARDRYGIKPLYYVHTDDLFIFASEIKSLIQHPAVDVRVDPQALLEYFTFQNIFTDRTLFQGVRLLPAGHVATLEVGNGRSFQSRRYWDFHFREPEKPLDARAYEEELNRLFAQAVRRQLVSDVPVGAYLSGGMDSGAITAVAARQMPYLATFTAGFDLSSASGLELAFDERKRAEALSYLFKTEHYEVVLKAGDMERVMPDLIWHLEDLRVGQSYPNYYIARLASKFVKVVLGGAGGDELFAGYPWRYYRVVKSLSSDDYVERYYRYWQRLVPNRVIHRLFQPEVWDEVKDCRTIDIFRSVVDQAPGPLQTPEQYLNRSLYFEIKTFLHGLLLVEDKLNMAHGLETRLPYLDNDLVDFAMQVPVRLKLRDLDEVMRIDENEPGFVRRKYFEKTNDGKLILRNVLAKYVPPEYVEGIKQGFSAPDASWFRGESIDYVRDLLLDGDARIHGYLNPETVGELVNEHLTGEKNRRLLIWSLLSFEWWLRKFA